MMFHLKLLGVVATLFVLFACSSLPEDHDVAVLVEIDRPAGISDAELHDAFVKSLPLYKKVDGLKRKYFVHSEAHFGGVYLWDNTRSASAFFDSAWHNRIQSTYGQPASLTHFDVPTDTPGASPGSAGKDGVVAIVKVGAPWYAPLGTIASRMKDSIPDYNVITGLDYKIYSIADGKRVGGIYLWDNETAANAFYDPSWHARILATYDEKADLAFYRAPLVLVNQPD